MKREFRLVGLSKPRSATVEYFGSPGDSFNVKIEHNESLWNYCKNNWDTVELKVVVEYYGLEGGVPKNGVVIEVLPIEYINPTP